MLIPAECEHCKVFYDVDQTLIGRTVQCPKCASPLRLKRAASDKDPEKDPTIDAIVNGLGYGICTVVVAGIVSIISVSFYRAHKDIEWHTQTKKLARREFRNWDNGTARQEPTEHEFGEPQRVATPVLVGGEGDVVSGVLERASVSRSPSRLMTGSLVEANTVAVVQSKVKSVGSYTNGAGAYAVAGSIRLYDKTGKFLGEKRMDVDTPQKIVGSGKGPLSNMKYRMQKRLGHRFYDYLSALPTSN